MADIVGIIELVEDDLDYNQKPYKKVTVNAQQYKVKQGRGGALKDKWGLLQEGTAINLIMSDFTKEDGVKIPYVSDIKTVAGALPPPVKVEPSQAVIDATPKPVPAPQAVGMCIKELGDMIRADRLEIVFGVENALKLLGWYRRQVSSITGVNAEGVK